jgi:hypothetical protein
VHVILYVYCVCVCVIVHIHCMCICIAYVMCVWVLVHIHCMCICTVNVWCILCILCYMAYVLDVTLDTTHMFTVCSVRVILCTQSLRVLYMPRSDLATCRHAAWDHAYVYTMRMHSVCMLCCHTLRGGVLVLIDITRGPWAPAAKAGRITTFALSKTDMQISSRDLVAYDLQKCENLRAAVRETNATC